MAGGSICKACTGSSSSGTAAGAPSSLTQPHGCVVSIMSATWTASGAADPVPSETSSACCSIDASSSDFSACSTSCALYVLYMVSSSATGSGGCELPVLAQLTLGSRETAWHFQHSSIHHLATGVCEKKMHNLTMALGILQRLRVTETLAGDDRSTRRAEGAVLAQF